MRGAVEESGERRDRVVFARLRTDAPLHKSRGFRALLNSFLPRKRAIAQMLVRDTEGRVLLYVGRERSLTRLDAAVEFLGVSL